jgi:hypothetical protein
LLLARITWAHCDTTNGPVIPEAKAALEKGDVTSILKWIKKDNKAEIRAAFAKGNCTWPPSPAFSVLSRY